MDKTPLSSFICRTRDHTSSREGWSSRGPLCLTELPDESPRAGRPASDSKSIGKTSGVTSRRIGRGVDRRGVEGWLVRRDMSPDRIIYDDGRGAAAWSGERLLIQRRGAKPVCLIYRFHAPRALYKHGRHLAFRRGSLASSDSRCITIPKPM